MAVEVVLGVVVTFCCQIRVHCDKWQLSFFCPGDFQFVVHVCNLPWRPRFFPVMSKCFPF